MAVSQFLKPGSLLQAVQGYLTPGVIHSASSLVGESESATRQTMYGASASVLSGITIMASSREGAEGLSTMVREGGFGSAVDNIGSLLNGGNATTRMLNTGHQLLGRIFGGDVSSVADAVGRSGGIRSSSAIKLLSLAAPVVMGAVGKRVASQRLGASGLAILLQNERADTLAAAPPGLAQILRAGPTVVSSTSRAVATDERLSSPSSLEHFAEPTVETPPPREKSAMGWVPLALIALVVIGLLWSLRGRVSGPGVPDVVSRGVDAARQGLAQITLPGGSGFSAAPGSINYDLAKFLADSSSQGPKTFVFDNLNFEAKSTRLTPESHPTVNNLASILRAYPNAQVQLLGHTDNNGTPEDNQTLSLNRANAVKEILVNQGVGAGRISTQGLGQDHPVASNDTEEGRLRNRRTELVVTSK